MADELRLRNFGMLPDDFKLRCSSAGKVVDNSHSVLRLNQTRGHQLPEIFDSRMKLAELAGNDVHRTKYTLNIGAACCDRVHSVHS